MTAITRYAYVDTLSTAGRPERVDLDTRDVTSVRVWTNSYGNPTYALSLRDGRTLVCVDDYGAANNLSHAPISFCRTRRELL